MSADATGRPRPKLRTGANADQRPAPRAPDPTPPPTGREVPVRAVLLLGLAVLVVLAALRPGGVTAVLGGPLAVTLPGAVLQPRFLPSLHTDTVTRWCLRIALSVGAWALLALAVGWAGIPVRSVWTVVVGTVLLAGVVVGEPDGERRFGRLPLRHAAWGAVVVLAATVLALGGRGLVAVAGGSGGPTGAGPSVVVAYADPTVPLALSAPGNRASVTVVVTNSGSDDVTLEVSGQVGRALPWATVAVDLPAGATRTVALEGAVPVCSDPQQAVVTVAGAGDVPPLATVVPGAAGGTPCASS